MKIVELTTKKTLNEAFTREKLLNQTPLETLVEMAIQQGKPASKIVEELYEKAPPSAKAERFIKGQKADFKKRYGDKWQEVLYATAWKKFGEAIGGNATPDTVTIEPADIQKARKLIKDFKRLRSEFKGIVVRSEADEIRLETLHDNIEYIKSELFMMREKYGFSTNNELVAAINFQLRQKS
jgi:hypothetical protein